MAASSDEEVVSRRRAAPSSWSHPLPKSPLMYPDLHGKRREAARLQMLDIEILFLQEDLKFCEGLRPASACCRDVVDFVMAAADPLTRTNKKEPKSCRPWKWILYSPIRLKYESAAEDARIATWLVLRHRASIVFVQNGVGICLNLPHVYVVTTASV